MDVKDRSGNRVIDSSGQNRTLSRLYGTVPGRIVLRLITRPFVSKATGAYMNSRLSRSRIKKMTAKYSIDTTDSESREFRSFNDFFTRKAADGARPFEMDKNALVAPCDAKLSVYRIDENSIFHIKDAPYTVSGLLGGNKLLADEFLGGYVLIFRLSVDNLHRYSYFDSGTKGENVFIKGVLHTVNPIALEHYNFFHTNSREYTVMQTDSFGIAVQVEVGAMMVGKIKNYHGEYSFTRGEEKGMFEFGGSTCVLLLKKDTAVIDSDILENSENQTETVVKAGERIGRKI